MVSRDRRIVEQTTDVLVVEGVDLRAPGRRAESLELRELVEAVDTEHAATVRGHRRTS